MWAGDYIGSLTLFPDTLAELGATAGLGEVVFVEEGGNKCDMAFVVRLVNSAFFILHLLEEEGYFHFLKNMSTIAAELKSVWALYPQWKVTKITHHVEQTLTPIRDAVSCLAPDKAYCTLLCMKNFLEAVLFLNWDRQYCIEFLNLFHEDLTELQPRRHLNPLKYLHWLLLDNGQHLGRLASNPVIEKELGRPNLFDRLILIQVALEGVLNNGYLLLALQVILEKLDIIQAIDFQE